MTARGPHPAHPAPTLIVESAALAALCERLRLEAFVTVDTEFMRERTYWPELCVVQLAGQSEVAVVDAEAAGLDLAPLGALLADAAVTKVFHAARQDVEIFVQLFGAPPVPLFDTQIAAMVAGFGDQVGYDSLVAGLTGGQIDKAHRFTDWSRRPLSEAQIAYAAADVTWLRPVYQRLRDKLQAEGRLGWVAEEMAELADPATYRPDPDRIWERLRPRTGNRRLLGVLHALVAWREREAQRVNVPRGRILKDEALLEIAATLPGSGDALARVRGMSRGFAEGKMGAALLGVIAEAQSVPEPDLPASTATRDALRPSPALVALLKVLLAAKCEQHHVATRLVASSDDLDRLAAEDDPDVPATHGWRAEVFGRDAAALKAGRMALGVAGRRVRLLRTDPEARAS